ncbi:hypothetical protein CRYUN_Cryun14cG0075300 [Craigia yunnanensis]
MIGFGLISLDAGFDTLQDFRGILMAASLNLPRTSEADAEVPWASKGVPFKSSKNEQKSNEPLGFRYSRNLVRCPEHSTTGIANSIAIAADD